MSAKELVKMIDKTGYIFARGDMRVSVRVIDVKVTYGAVRYQIEPLAGNGTTWIDANSIEFYNE